MNIVIPMAGRGERFSSVGYRTPKPLIPIDGVPMYAWATASLPLERASKLIFIARKEQLDSGLREDIEERFGRYPLQILSIDRETSGQLATVLLAREFIQEPIPLTIFNVDSRVSTNFAARLPELMSPLDGIVSLFAASEPRWSFARLAQSGEIVEIQEKKPISNWATAGLYCFRDGGTFVHYADQMISENERTNGEFYVGPLYNRLIRDGGRILPDYCDEFTCAGTPEELELLLARQVEKTSKLSPVP